MSEGQVLQRQEFLGRGGDTAQVDVGEVGVAVDLQPGPAVTVLCVGGKRRAVLRVLLEDEAPKPSVPSLADQNGRAGLVDAN